MKTVKELVEEQGYTFWDGSQLESEIIAFDTETTVVDLKKKIPDLVLMTVSTPFENIVIPRSQIGSFVMAHQYKECWVGHNVAFDFWVVLKHLHSCYGKAYADVWREMYKANVFRDTMILDLLVRMGEMEVKTVLRPRNLGEVAEEWAEVEVDKEDPYRMRFGELLDVPEEEWAVAERAPWFLYAVGDTAVIPSVYLNLEARANELASESENYNRTWGLLTQDLQVKSNIVLASMARRGIKVDVPKVLELEKILDEEIGKRIEYLTRDHPNLFRRYKEKKRAGQWMIGKNGMLKMDLSVLRGVLSEVALEKGLEWVPKTAKTGQIQTSSDFWRENAGDNPFVAQWIELEEFAKKRQFVVKLKTPRIYPKYEILKVTGRVSSYGPNIQQIPRDPAMRNLFIADEGYTLGVVDYSFIELVTLAAVFESLYGSSKLGDVIRNDIDPHCYTAALLLDMDLDAFMAKKETDPVWFKHSRQSAKALNFGFPGGLGVQKFVAYAKTNYGVVITEDQARRFKHKLTTEIYPELGLYLNDEDAKILATNLHTSERQVKAAIEGSGSFAGAYRALGNIVYGNPFKFTGEPYNDFYVNKTWESLQRLNNNPDLVEPLSKELGSSELKAKLFGRKTTTLTGRVRGGTGYTEDKNTRFQGLAADGAKQALVDLFEAGFLISIFVHDEIVTQLPLETAEEDLKRQQRIMENAMSRVLQCDLPVKTEGVLTRQWTK